MWKSKSSRLSYSLVESLPPKKKKKKKESNLQSHKPLVPAVVVAAIHMANQDLVTDVQRALPGEEIV